MKFGSQGPAQASVEDLSLGSAGAIVPIADALARQRRSDRWRFLLTVALTWIALSVIVVGGLFAAGKIDLAFLADWAPYILAGAPLTLFIAASSITIAIVFAILGALGRLSSRASLYGLASFYVSIVRGTPLIVQILFVYLALPQIWEGFADVPIILLGIFALAFNYGAYMTEIF